MSMPTVVEPPIAVPQQRAAAAAAKVDDQIVTFGREKRAQHVVSDSRPEERRRHGLVSRVAVERLVEVLVLLGISTRGRRSR